MVSFLGCCLLREVSRSLVARRYGINTSAIEFALLAEPSLESRPRAPRQEFFIAGAAVLVHPVIAGLIFAGHWFVLGVSGEAWERDFLFVLMEWNILYGSVNLVPGFPMDGGRVLRSFSWQRRRGSRRRVARKFSYLKATHLPVRIGQIVGIGAVLAAPVLGIWGGWSVLVCIMLALIGLCIWADAGAEWEKVRKRIEEEPRELERELGEALGEM